MIANATMTPAGAVLQFVCTIPELGAAVYITPIDGGGWSAYYQNDVTRSLPPMGHAGAGEFSFLAGFIHQADGGGYVARAVGGAPHGIRSADVPSAARRVVELHEQVIADRTTP